MKEEKEKKRDHRKALIVWTIAVSVVLVIAIVLSVVFTYSLTDGYSNLYGLYPDEVLSVSESDPDENGVVTRDISEVTNGERTDYKEYITPDGSVYDFYPYYVSIDMGQESLFDVFLVFEEKPSKDDLHFNSYPKAVATCANVSSMYFTENYFWYFDEEIYKKYFDDFDDVSKNYFQEEVKSGDVYELSYDEDLFRYDASGFFRDGFYTLSMKVEGKEYGYDFYLDTNNPVGGTADLDPYRDVYVCYKETPDGEPYQEGHDYGVGLEDAYFYLPFDISALPASDEHYSEIAEWVDRYTNTPVSCSDNIIDGVLYGTYNSEDSYDFIYGADSRVVDMLGYLWDSYADVLRYIEDVSGTFIGLFSDYRVYTVDYAGNIGITW